MQHDTPLHNRHSIRLKGYDYSKAGAYFITICVKDKIHFFGKIENGEMVLNDAGKMIDKWWQKIPEKYPDIELGEYQIMPNHFHAIVINVGADPRVRPNSQPQNDGIVRADPRVRPKNTSSDSNESSDSNKLDDFDIGQTHGSAPTDGDMNSPLWAVVQWYKTMSTNEYIHGVKKLGWRPFYGKLWQRNYYEHIIRDEKSYNAIADYINNNPANWANDDFYLK